MAEQLVHRESNEFDEWKSLSLSLYMTLVGYAVLVGQPVINTNWVLKMGLTEAQVGIVASFDQGGLTFGAIATSIFISRFNRRHLVIFSGALAILANFLCISHQTYEAHLVLRAAAGFGSGMLTAVAVAALGGTSKPARSYNLMLFAFAFSQFSEMRIVPLLDIRQMYWFFMGMFASCLVLVRYVVPYAAAATVVSQADPSRQQTSAVHAYIPWLCLAAICITYTNIGAYWSYIELASLDAGISHQWTGQVLSWASLLSVVGCAFATVVSNRFGFARPLTIALITMTTIVGMLALGINDYKLMGSVFMFNFLWIFIDVYQMSTVAIIDPKGSYSALIPGAQGAGYIIGPIAGSLIIGTGLGYSVFFVFCASAAFTGMLIYWFMYSRLLHNNPDLAHRR